MFNPVFNTLCPTNLPSLTVHINNPMRLLQKLKKKQRQPMMLLQRMPHQQHQHQHKNTSVKFFPTMRLNYFLTKLSPSEFSVVPLWPQSSFEEPSTHWKSTSFYQ